MSTNLQQNIENISKKKGSICLLGSWLSIHTRRLATALAQRGYEIHCITFASCPFQVDGVKVYVVPPFLGKRERFISYLLRYPYIKYLINSISPTVILAIQTTDYGFIGALTKTHFPLIVFAIGSDVLKNPFINKNEDIRGKIKAPVWRLINRIVFKRTDLIVSELYAKTILEKVFNVPTHRLHGLIWGADAEVYQNISEEHLNKWRDMLSISSDQPIIISSRSMKQLYNIDTIVLSISILRKKFPNIVFILLTGIGYPPYVQHIKNLIKSHMVENNVRLIEGFLPPKEVAALFHLSDILVSIPSSDSFPLTALEGGMCGSIPILSNIPANRQALALGLKGILLERTNEQELANKIEEVLLMNEESRTEIKEWNKKWVTENASWEATINQLEKLFKKVEKDRKDVQDDRSPHLFLGGIL